MNKHKQLLIVWLTGVVSTIFLLLGSASAYATANVSYAYNASTSLTNGDIVSLVAKGSNYVKLTNTSNASRLLGVITSNNGSLLAVNPSSHTVQVATSGSTPVLVSTINGPITVGDQISVSPLTGIGMKAGSGLPLVGLAQTGFNSSSANASTKHIVTSSGQSETVSVGYIMLVTKIGGVSNTGQVQLNQLQRIVKSLTGRTVSTVRIIISLIVTLVAIISLGVLIYSSIFSSIISIGRNPLAKASITRTLTSVLIMAIILAIVAVIVVNFLLR